MRLIPLIIILLTCFSCGQKKNSSPLGQITHTQADPNTLQEEKNPDGQYLARLLPINSHLSGELVGSMTLSIDKDEFVGDVRFSGNEQTTAQITLEQTIHIGNRCPNLSDDLNEDGVIDESELFSVAGQVLIPLDGDLNSQWLGANSYPLSDSFGSYYYNQVASWNKLLEDLWDEDINFEDQLTKLVENNRPDFENKIAIIRGISSQVILPQTVEKLSTKNIHSTLPLLCGVFKKVRTTPGRRNIETYPMPVELGENPEDDLEPSSDVPETVINYGN